jgi:hypothetical protein
MDDHSERLNEVAAQIFFRCADLYDEYTAEEVLVGMAACLSQSIAGRSLSPDTCNTILGNVMDQPMPARSSPRRSRR